MNPTGFSGIETQERLRKNQAGVLQEISRLAAYKLPCPSNAAMGERIGLTESQVRTALTHLRKTGEVDVQTNGTGRRRLVLTLSGVATGFTKASERTDTAAGSAYFVQGDTTPRKCLCCGTMFPSYSVGHRICNTCKRTDAFEGGGDLGGVYL